MEKLVSHLARQLRGSQVHFMDVILHLVLGHDDAGGVEGIGFNHVAANLVERRVDVGNQVRAAEHQDVVVAFLAAEVVERRIAQLDIGAHRPVENDDALLYGL